MGMKEAQNPLVKRHFPFAEDMELARSCCSCWASLCSFSVGVLSVRSDGKESRDPYTKSLNSEFLRETWSVRARYQFASLIWMSVCIQNLFTLYGVMRNAYGRCIVTRDSCENHYNEDLFKTFQLDILFLLYLDK